MITEFILHYDACVGRLPNGYRVWKCQTDDGVHYAIADDSGMLPHTTDDGPMFLDCSRTLKAGTFIAIPVFDEYRQEFNIPGDSATILFLSKFLNWTIEDPANDLFYIASDPDTDSFLSKLLGRIAAESPRSSAETTTTWSYPYERTY